MRCMYRNQGSCFMMKGGFGRIKCKSATKLKKKLRNVENLIKVEEKKNSLWV